jgi:hypothetical protein
MARLLEGANGQIFLLDSRDRVVISLGQYGSPYAGAAASTVTAAPAATTSTTMVMLGAGILYTPVFTGKVKVEFGGIVGNTNGNGSKLQIAYGTGAAPANGAALVGTTVGTLAYPIALTGALTAGFQLNAIVILNVGTTYWFDLQFEAVTGGTATATAVTASAYEVV